jgi:hypothetical protein
MAHKNPEDVLKAPKNPVDLFRNSDSSNVLVDLAASAFGLGSCLLTGLALWVFARMTGFAIYKFTLWLILPVGAILAGWAGASGFSLGYRIFRRRPGRMLLLNILGGSIGTFLLIYYLSFAAQLARFPDAAGHISFWSFLDASIRRSSITVIGAPSTGDLGYFGYITTTLEVLGFSLGGVFIYSHLCSLLYCDRCGRRVEFVDDQVRYGSRDGLIVLVQVVAAAYRANDPAGGIRLHSEFGSAVESKDSYLRSVSTLYACGHCRRQKVTFALERANGANWTPLQGTVVEAASDTPLAVHGVDRAHFAAPSEP